MDLSDSAEQKTAETKNTYYAILITKKFKSKQN